jgi:hypothetical protein
MLNIFGAVVDQLLQAAILSLRKNMWTNVTSRRHTLGKVFVLGSEQREVMLFGTVAYRFNSGGIDNVEWAARARFSAEKFCESADAGAGTDAAIKLEFYQVYLVSAVLL